MGAVLNSPFLSDLKSLKFMVINNSIINLYIEFNYKLLFIFRGVNFKIMAMSNKIHKFYQNWNVYIIRCK